jgi:hypothetical protein
MLCGLIAGKSFEHLLTGLGEALDGTLAID